MTLLAKALFLCILHFSTFTHAYIPISSFNIPTYDGLHLNAIGYLPNGFQGKASPLLIFPNSWTFDNTEYDSQAKSLADAGYICISYCTRGWYSSQGIINVAGPEDRKDGSSIIDFALNQTGWNVDPMRIGFVGISYGGGISLMMAGYDNRVTVVVAMSAWGNMSKSFYCNDSPNSKAVWDLISKAGENHGTLPDSLESIYNYLTGHVKFQFVYNFTAERSTNQFLPQINARKVPIFMGTSMLDRYFEFNDYMDMFNKIEGDKFMVVNQGAHAEEEYLSMTGIPGTHHIWDKATMWLNQFMMGMDTGILNEPKIQFQYGMTVFSGDYITMNTWPDLAVIRQTRYQLTPRGSGKYGGLSTGASAGGGNDQISFSTDPGLELGTYGTSDYLISVGLAPRYLLGKVSTSTAIIFETPDLSTTKICGVPSVDISFVPTCANGTVSRDWQLYAFVYEVGIFQSSRIISDGTFTNFATSGYTSVESLKLKSGNLITIKNWLLRPLCTDISNKDNIALGFTLYNVYYTPATTDLKMTFDLSKASLTMPILM